MPVVRDGRPKPLYLCYFHCNTELKMILLPNIPSQYDGDHQKGIILACSRQASYKIIYKIYDDPICKHIGWIPKYWKLRMVNIGIRVECLNRKRFFVAI